MNIIQVARTMDEGQIAVSKTCGKVIRRDYGIYWYIAEDHKNDTPVSLNDMNVVYEDDFEIELPYVDFWTAWKSARDEGWAILWEKAEVPNVYSNLLYVSPDMINGRWQILNQ